MDLLLIVFTENCVVNIVNGCKSLGMCTVLHSSLSRVIVLVFKAAIVERVDLVKQMLMSMTKMSMLSVPVMQWLSVLTDCYSDIVCLRL